jgi:hypothetical protein
MTKSNALIVDLVLFSRPTPRTGFGDRFDGMIGDEIDSDPKRTTNLRPTKCGEAP